MSIRWISKNLGSGPANEVSRNDNFYLLDVRDLVDKAGNNKDIVYLKIAEGLAQMEKGVRLVVGCDYGISRSNAVAAGILARFRNISLNEAVREVMAKTGEPEIKLELLEAVRVALGDSPPIPNSNQNRVLVTGGTGFLGKPLISRLQEDGAFVMAPPRTELDILKDRVLFDLIIKENHIGCVVHLANPRIYTSNLALGETLAIFRNVLESCVNNKCFLIYPSPCEVYSGYATKELFANELLPALAKGPYGETKFLCEILLTHFRQLYSLKCALLRMCPLYGFGGDRPKFVHTFIAKALRGETIKTHHYRNSAASLDLLHLDDAANLISTVISSQYEGDLNIGTGKLTSTDQIARWIIGWTQSSSQVQSVPIEADTACIAMNYQRAKSLFGWSPKINIEDGLESLVKKLISK